MQATETAILDFPMPRSHPLHPPSIYAALRESQPVRRVRTPRGQDAWLITRHADVVSVLNDRRFSSDPRAPGFPTYLTGDLPPPPGFFMQADAPDHTRLRRYVSREFLSARVEEKRPRIRDIFNELIDELTAAGSEAELIEQFALPMAARVICDLLGVQPQNSGLIKDNVDKLLNRATLPEDVGAAAAVLTSHFQEIVADKLRTPTPDLLGALAQTVSEPEGPSVEELVGIAMLLLIGGYDTMVQMIGLGTLTLLEHPKEAAALRANPSLMPAAVDELLRFHTVNHAGLPRAATVDVEIGGQLIKARDGVLVMINAANRDPATFPNPDVFDIDRKLHSHVAFGHGLHKCIGMPLAKIELEEVFGGLLRRLPNLRVTAPLDALSFRHEMVLYGLQALPVAW